MKRKRTIKDIKKTKNFKYISLENIAVFSALVSVILLSAGLYLLPGWLGSRMLILGSIFLWIFIITAFLIAIK